MKKRGSGRAFSCPPQGANAALRFFCNSLHAPRNGSPHASAGGRILLAPPEEKTPSPHLKRLREALRKSCSNFHVCSIFSAVSRIFSGKSATIALSGCTAQTFKQVFSSNLHEKYETDLKQRREKIFSLLSHERCFAERKGGKKVLFPPHSCTPEIAALPPEES